MAKRFMLKIGDVLLISLILISAAVLFFLPFLGEKATEAEILLAETGEKKIVSLEKNATHEIISGGVTLTVTVENGKIFVSSSNCRDGICRNTPPISRAGQTIVCAPAGVVIRILGKEADIDGVSG